MSSVGFIDRIWHQRNFTLAETFTDKLRLLNQISLEETAKSSLLKDASALHRKLKPLQDPRVNALGTEILALKLGIKSEILQRYPDFTAFASKHHLHQYLDHYHHQLSLNPNGDLLIKMNGIETHWDQAFQAYRNLSQLKGHPVQEWVYGEEGLQSVNMYDWESLVPFKREDPAKWNYQYIFEFCACHNPHSIKNLNHTWLRLKTPTGDVYSVGLYRPGKNFPLIDNLKFPLRIKAGYLMQPDVSEFWSLPIRTIPIAISQKDFEQMKQAIEVDKKNDDQTFQLFGDNCTLYAAKIAAIGGIKLPTSERVVELITPTPYKKPLASFFNRLPKLIQKVCDCIQALFVNLLTVALGASLVDRGLNSKQKARAIPRIQSWKDLFKPEKSYLNHPNTLAFKTRDLVYTWRKHKMAKLLRSNLSKEISHQKAVKIWYGLPAKFRSHAA